MISVIICSINISSLKELTENIRTTIGIPFEIIAIDNSELNDGICKVYNKAGAMANYDILCFMHEDVRFDTSDWGILVHSYLKDKDTGLVGLAGGDTRGLVPSSWSVFSRSPEVNIIQHPKNNISVSKYISIKGSEPLRRVVGLDGVLLCTRKDVFQQFKFDEQMLSGFHGYDMDFSLQVLTKYKIKVMSDIMVHHYSEGTADRDWIDAALKVANKWKSKLPVSVYHLSKEEWVHYHWKSLQVFLQHLMRLGYKNHQVLFYYLFYSATRFFNLRRFLSMTKYVFISILSRRSETIGPPVEKEKWKMAKVG